MENYVDITVLFVVAFLLLTRPNVLVNFSNTFFGKLMLISILVVTTLHSTLSGIFIGLLIVVLSENVYEGMENQDGSEEKHDSEEEQNSSEEQYDSDNQQNKIKELKEKYCKKKNDKMTFIDSKGNELSLEEIKQKYPAIKFDKDTCNPCDDTCSYQITDSLEQLNIQETLRPKNSKEINVSKS